MTSAPLRIVLLGLSITSSWGNGHATTYRALVRALGLRGHDVLFLERDAPWYAAHRDMPAPAGGTTRLYRSLDELRSRCEADVRTADLVIVGSYVPEGTAVGEWVVSTARGVTAFYDIDTPVTLARLSNGGVDYLSRRLIPKYDVYLSFTGGPTLARLEQEFGARRARPLYCSVDAEAYTPSPGPPSWDLGYLGTYSPDRQPALEALLIEPARQMPGRSFAVAGARYPESADWPPNVTRIEHVAPGEHPQFYSRQRFTLNLTRRDMIQAGWSPSVRLFEAAACGTPLVSDWWEGLDAFFEPEREILIARSPRDLSEWLEELPEGRRLEIGARARARVLAAHTAMHRAAAVESYWREAR